MQRFFVADVHLNENEPDITTGFLSFLQSLPDQSELYILGDLFDYWIGDDLATELQQTVAKALNNLKRRGINSYFIHGNRDFLLGSRFAKKCQMALLPEIYLIDSDAHRIVLLHGDLLCIDDPAYQKFRKKMHNKWLQRLFLLLPRYFRQKIANKLRNKSSEHNQHKVEYIMDVNAQYVDLMMSQYQGTTMVHGHTHKPATHTLDIAGLSAERIVLGAWHDGANYIHQDETGQFKWVN